jgi:hypothetical protein
VYQNLTVIPGHYLNSREYIAKCVDEGGDAAAAAAAWTPKAVCPVRTTPSSSATAGQRQRSRQDCTNCPAHRGDGRAGADADHDD